MIFWLRAAAVATALLCAILVPGAQAQSPPTAAGGALGFTGANSGKPINIEADNGIEWEQANHVYIARGHAKATRGDTSVTADTLYAYYRPVPGGTTPAAAAAAPAKGSDPFDNGSTQVYRIEANGNVVFSTPTQTAYGDHAIYDVDQAVLVMTGKHLKIVTPQDTITARDSFEWYDRKQLGVARGDALAIRKGPPSKSIKADVLIAEVTKQGNQPSKISKIDAHGHVVLISQDEIARADEGVYNLDTGIATLSGHVSLTRGGNELRGQYGVVDTVHNVARLLSAPSRGRSAGAPPPVEGLLVPRQPPPPAAPKK